MKKAGRIALLMMTLATVWTLLPGCKDRQSAEAKIQKADIPDASAPTVPTPAPPTKTDRQIAKGDVAAESGAGSAETMLFRLAVEQMKHELDLANRQLDDKKREQAQELARKAELQRAEIYQQGPQKEKKP